MRRKRFRHESELHERFYAGLVKRVEDVVQDRPVIDWASRTRLRCRRSSIPISGKPTAISRCEKIVHANVDRVGTELREFAQQLLPIRCVSVVRLVVAPEIPDGRKPSVGLVSVHDDAYIRITALTQTNAHCPKKGKEYAPTSTKRTLRGMGTNNRRQAHEKTHCTEAPF